MIGAEDSERILMEILLKRHPASQDTEEQAAHRALLIVQCAKIAADGFAVAIPHEIPDLD